MMFLDGIRACFAAGFLVIGNYGVAAQNNPQKIFADAVDSLTVRLGPAETGPTIETTDRARNAADIAAIEKALESFGSPEFPVNGFTTFETVCEQLNRLSVRHGLDGISALRQPADAPPPGLLEQNQMMAQVKALQLHNAKRHEDAITILSGSGLRCTVMHFPVLAEHLASLPEAEITPVRLNGARQMRLGIAQSVLGYMEALSDPATSAETKKRLRGYIEDMAMPLTGALTPELRAEMRAAIGQLPQMPDTEILATTTLLQSAMATTECVELCLYR